MRSILLSPDPKMWLWLIFSAMLYAMGTRLERVLADMEDPDLSILGLIFWFRASDSL